MTQVVLERASGTTLRSVPRTLTVRLSMTQLWTTQLWTTQLWTTQLWTTQQWITT